MRVVDFLFLGMAIAGAALVFDVKNQAETAHEDRRTIEREIAGLTREIGLLEAEQAVLQQPSRLQVLVDTLGEDLGLAAMSADQHVPIEAIPFRRPREQQTVEAIDAADIAGADPVETGSVPPVEPVDDRIGSLLEGLE